MESNGKTNQRALAQKYLRGQVYWADVEETKGGGPIMQKTRPVLIVSNDVGNHFGDTVVVVPLSTRARDGLPMHVNFYFNGVSQMVFTEQIKTIETRTLQDYMFTCSLALMGRVDYALTVTLGIEQMPDPPKPAKASKPAPKVDEAIEYIQAENAAIAAAEREDKADEGPADEHDFDKAVEKPATVETGKPDDTKNEPGPGRKSRRKPNGFWTADRQAEFMEDLAKLSAAEMAVLYGLKDEGVVQTYMRHFRKAAKEKAAQADRDERKDDK